MSNEPFSRTSNWEATAVNGRTGGFALKQGLKVARKLKNTLWLQPHFTLTKKLLLMPLALRHG